jgi:Domain of unknown function (DUF4342)
MTEDIRRERHNVTGEKLLETVKHILHEGNVRRIIIKDHEDHTIIEVPLTVGVVGVLVAPVAAALGAVAALVAHLTIEVEKVGPPARAGGEQPGAGPSRS